MEYFGKLKVPKPRRKLIRYLFISVFIAFIYITVGVCSSSSYFETDEQEKSEEITILQQAIRKEKANYNALIVEVSPENVVDSNCYPKLLLIGAQKTGTSSFHSWIKSNFHSQLKVPLEAKELNFFNDKWDLGKELVMDRTSTDDPIFEKWILDYSRPVSENMKIVFEDLSKWYAGQWGNLKNCSNNILVEASPNYMIHPKVPARIKQWFPKMKFLVLLRNPVDRILSAMNMKWQEKLCKEKAWTRPDCFQELIDNNKYTNEALISRWRKFVEYNLEEEIERFEACFDLYGQEEDPLAECEQIDQLTFSISHSVFEDSYHVGRSLYYEHLKRWFKVFDTKQFYFASSEEFDKNPRKQMTNIVRWLQLDVNLVDDKIIDNYRHHSRDYIQKSLELPIIERLENFLAPMNEKLFDLLQRQGHGYVVPSLKKHFNKK